VPERQLVTAGRGAVVDPPGAVDFLTPAEASNNLRNEIGNMTPGSIDGSLSATTVVKGPSMLLISPQDHLTPGQPGVSHPLPTHHPKLRKQSDLFSRRLLGYAMSEHHDIDLIVAC
jgi:hypothetical protein